MAFFVARLQGTLIAGILVVFLSVFLPFEFLDDMTSAGKSVVHRVGISWSYVSM